MAIVTPSEYVQVGGKVSVYLAFPLASYVANHWPFDPERGSTPANNRAAYLQLFKLGELEDEARPRKRFLTNKVMGDRAGGSAGDGIEFQAMGYVYDIELTMSRWDPEVLALLENLGGLYPGTDASNPTAAGAVPLTTIGALLMRDRSTRVLLHSAADSRLTDNFPCCLMDGAPRQCGRGTKYSVLQLNFTAHRAPEGHWGVPASGTDLVTGHVENKDVTGMS